MLTVIPEEEFLQLCEGVSEANASKRNFNWTTMLKWSNTRDRINQYMASTNTKFIGAGSSRTAYYLPQGKYGPNKLDTPACFKVANNVKGVAQNRLEIKNLKKFSNEDWPCFPYLYDWDNSKKLFLLCEVGTAIYKGGIEKKYFNQWDDFSSKYTSAITDEKLKSIYRLFGKDPILDIFHPHELYDLVRSFNDTIKELSRLKDSKKKEHKVMFNLMMEFFDSVAKKYPKYNGIVSTIKFCIDHTKEISPGDFETTENWAFVKRGKDYVAIPIDWGFNEEIWNKYYKNQW